MLLARGQDQPHDRRRNSSSARRRWPATSATSSPSSASPPGPPRPPTPTTTTWSRAWAEAPGTARSVRVPHYPRFASTRRTWTCGDSRGTWRKPSLVDTLQHEAENPSAVLVSSRRGAEMGAGTCLRNTFLAAALCAALVISGVRASSASGVSGGSTGATHNKVPPQVVAQVEALQRAFGSLVITPTSGPVGTQIIYQGWCGFPASTLTWALAFESEPGNFIAVLRRADRNVAERCLLGDAHSAGEQRQHHPRCPLRRRRVV